MSNKSLLKRLRQLSPRKFEKVVSEVWSARGWKTKVTKGAHDYGIDVEATKRDLSGYYAFQAKKYEKSNRIGGPDVRKYATLYKQDPDIRRVIIVTTSSFTKQALELGQDLSVDLITGDKLAAIIRSENYRPFSEKESTSRRKSTTRKKRSHPRSELPSDPHKAIRKLKQKMSNGEMGKGTFKRRVKEIRDEIRSE